MIKHPSRWSVVVLNQDAKVTRRFVVLSSQDVRPVFNCVECVSYKGSTPYPDVEIEADGTLFTNKSLVRTGYIYTLPKENIEAILGTIKDQNIMRKIVAGVHVFLPKP